jgi:glutamate N-acetyltransferase/amino-acid N-acetyltransferase
MAQSWKKIRGGVTAPRGYFAAGVSCGIKAKGGKDLALLFSETPAAWAATLTTNRAPAAPVLLTKDLLRRRRPLQAVLVNSGNANAATGEEGLRAAKALTAETARLLGLPVRAAVMASTGIIGEQLPLKKIVRALPSLVKSLGRGGGRAAAEGIMTTDSFAKEEALELNFGRGEKGRIGGMSKGAGMIHPDMATLLGFLSTDVSLPAGLLRACLREAVEVTFNRISIDGDRSTNDTVLIMANGAGGTGIDPGGPKEKIFREGLREVCGRLAEKIVLDGEGATKLVEVLVTGARNRADAERAARAVANSSLVKTAWFGQDLNWGRIVAALGYSGAAIDVGRTSILVNGRAAVRRGTAVPAGELALAQRQMRRKRLSLTIDLGVGKASDRLLTCDLSVEYVRENALYTT